MVLILSCRYVAQVPAKRVSLDAAECECASAEGEEDMLYILFFLTLKNGGFHLAEDSSKQVDFVALNCDDWQLGSFLAYQEI